MTNRLSPQYAVRNEVWRKAVPFTLMLAFMLSPLLGLSAPRPVSADSGEWVIECVDCPKEIWGMTDRSLRLDADGHPHIAYGGDHLYYAWYDGANWHYETADNSSGVGGDTSLALEGGGYPHISYYDGIDEDLKYAYYSAGWQHFIYLPLVVKG